MTKFRRDSIEVIIVGLIFGIIIILAIILPQQAKITNISVINAVVSLQTEINNLREEINLNEKNNEQSFSRLDENDTRFLNLYDYLFKKITNLPQKIKSDKFQLEQKLKQVNVMIVNKTIDALGSGVTIKYKDKFYILSAGHMVEDDDDNIVLMENGNEIGELEIIKRDYNLDEKNTKGDDLTLFKPKDSSLNPRFYVELADNESVTGSEIYIVGNPIGIEDVVSDGRIIIYDNNFFYFIDHSYFGNSGGGIYTREGKLLGIVSHLVPI